MNGLDAFVLGIVQGLTEFLPVSSKGHLVMAETLLGVRLNSLSFEILVHQATLGAVLVLLWPTIWRVLRERDLGYVSKLALACLPVGIVGLWLKEPIERVFHEPVLTGYGLLFTGCVLFSLRFIRRGQRMTPTYAGAFAIGCAQVLALMPGVSRSGMTISAALLTGVIGTAAAEFSFLVSLPVIAAAGLLELRDLAGRSEPASIPVMAVGFLAAFVSGIVAIRLVYAVLTHHRFSDFAFYCWFAGALFLLYVVSR